MLQGYICQYWQRYNTFSSGRITYYKHKIACIYIVIPQQKWNNTYLETTYKLDWGEILQNSVFKVKSWLRLKKANEN